MSPSDPQYKRGAMLDKAERWTENIDGTGQFGGFRSGTQAYGVGVDTFGLYDVGDKENQRKRGGTTTVLGATGSNVRQQVSLRSPASSHDTQQHVLIVAVSALYSWRNFAPVSLFLTRKISRNCTLKSSNWSSIATRRSRTRTTLVPKSRNSRLRFVSGFYSQSALVLRIKFI